MQITRSSIDTRKGLADWFIGDVYIDAVADPAGTATFASALVHFTPAPAPPGNTHPHRDRPPGRSDRARRSTCT